MTRIPSIRSRNGERGIALVVVLILLLVMSMLALVSLRSTLMEERMSANMADRSASFQAAEAALRQGEQIASAKPAVPGSGCLNGLCAIPSATAAPVWTCSRRGRRPPVHLGPPSLKIRRACPISGP